MVHDHYSVPPLSQANLAAPFAANLSPWFPFGPAQALMGLPLSQQQAVSAQAAANSYLFPPAATAYAPGVFPAPLGSFYPMGDGNSLMELALRRLGDSQDASARSQTHLAMSRIPPKHLQFAADPKGLHIRDFFQRLEAFHNDHLSDMDKINMCLARLDGQNSLLANLVMVGWTGSYRALKEWLIRTYDGLG